MSDEQLEPAEQTGWKYKILELHGPLLIVIGGASYAAAVYAVCWATGTELYALSFTGWAVAGFMSFHSRALWEKLEPFTFDDDVDGDAD